MTTAYTKTDNYGLNLYGDNDPADLRDGYNGSMRTIDTTMEQHLNRIESVEARETHDEAVMKALLVDNTVDNATASKTKWDKAGIDATAAASKADANTAILAALGADSTVNAATQKTKWNKAVDTANSNAQALTALGSETTDKANANKVKWNTAATTATSNNQALTALGSNTVGTATANRSKWDKAATDATAALNAVHTPDKLKDYVVVLGDSWVDGYYGGAKHIDQSPAVAIKEKLSPQRFYYKGSSAGGFAISGDNGTFADIWNTVPDKSKVTAVIVIGGQNDATGLEQQRTSESVITSKARELMQTIHAEAPNAEIHVCPMVLAVGQTLTKTQNHGANRAHRLAVVKALTLNLKDLGFGWIRVHEGGYRIGVVASQASDGGDGGDGAHLSRGGYVLAGYWIAHCIAAGIDLWPTNYGGPSDSQISGTWDYVNIYEHDGILFIGFKVNYNAKPNNSDRIFKLPKWATIGNPHYYLNFDSKGFVAIDNNTLSIQNAGNLDNTGIIVGSYTIPAGM
jgi:hypothetical protein